MKLYYAPGACSLASHIVLEELGIDFEIERISTKTHLTETGRDFYEINPKGYVPALELDGGEILTEGPAIMQLVADQHPSSLAPKPGTLERARLQEWLTFIGTEIHKTFSPLFSPETPEAFKVQAKEKLAKRFDFVEAAIADGRDYLLGEAFTLADAYLFAVTRWSTGQGIDLGRWPWLSALMDRINQRPATVRAFAAEARTD